MRKCENGRKENKFGNSEMRKFGNGRKRINAKM